MDRFSKYANIESVWKAGCRSLSPDQMIELEILLKKFEDEQKKALRCK